MITKFAVTNYRGFPQRIEFNLAHPGNYTFNSYAVKNGIIKNGIVFGPNGSGKSNLAMAIFDIVNHLTQRWKKPDYYDNFVYAGNAQSPVTFEYTFKLDEYNIEYNYSKSSNGTLIEEQLTVNSNVIFKKEHNSLKMHTKEFPLDSSVIKNLGSNANSVSIVNYLLSSFPLSKTHYLIRLRDFVNSMLWFRCLESREFIGLVNSTTNLNEYIIKNNLTEDFEKFLFNISGQNFDFVIPQKDDKLLYCNFNGNKAIFNQIASTGTHSLTLLYYWIKQMSRASFVFIDEFDAFYHFKLSFEVCRQLFALDCQVFVSSHNTYLMTNDLLRPDCNFILDNNKIKPLSECTEKELRFGHNIEKMFRGGTFTT